MRLVLVLIIAAGCSGEPVSIIDAGTIDATTIDAGTIDAGTIDAGTIDAGTIDATELDGGIIPPDGGLGLCMVAVDELVAATLSVTTDDNTKVYLNGVLIDDSVHTWSDPQQYAVMIYRHPSRTNVLALEGVNLFNQAGYDRGILADLRFTIRGQPQYVVTDTQFRATNTLSPGWEQPSFVDSAWPTAFDLGPHGISPWGNVFASLAPGTTASWLWTYDPAANANKPQLESTYTRRTFSVIDPQCPVSEGL